MPRMNKIGSTATSIRTESGYTRVKYHSTDVVEFNDKKIILNNGGRRTVTTKNRMNQASNQFGLGYRVCQKDHEWYVSFKGSEIDFSNHMVLTR